MSVQPAVNEHDRDLLPPLRVQRRVVEDRQLLDVDGLVPAVGQVGDVVDPDDRTFRASEAQRERLRRYVSEWFPGLDPDTPAEISCTYTSTVSGKFILDAVGPITVGAGFSGHGFKFTPAIGGVLADAATGRATPPEFFRLAAHAAA